MKERPILFSSPMIKAILAGTKSQTRRIVRGAEGTSSVTKDVIGSQPNDLWWIAGESAGQSTFVRCPYGQPGDRLWVRETHCFLDGDFRPTKMKDQGHVQVIYRADHAIDPVHGDGPDKLTWRPSIYMPRWASRITLKITDIRVERLQAIMEDDAKAEGVTSWADIRGCWSEEQTLTSGERMLDSPYRSGFAVLWDEINGDRALWKSNPFVWVVSFKRVLS
jgi:hypothetical protein